MIAKSSERSEGEIGCGSTLMFAACAKFSCWTDCTEVVGLLKDKMCLLAVFDCSSENELLQ